MPDDVVGAARIHIEPDFSGFDAALEAGVQAAADQAAEAIVAAFRGAAETSAQELSQIGQAGLVDVTATADTAATDIEAAFAAAAAESDEALGTIGAGAADEIAGSFAGTGDEIADQFVGVGDRIAAEIEAGGAAAEGALEGIGAGAGDQITAEFSGVGDVIGASVQQGASEASAGFSALEGAGQGVVESLTESFHGLGGVIAVIGGAFAVGSIFTAGERVASIIGVTNTLIETTGGVANVTAKEILFLGDSLEDLTGIESELTQEASNVLLTFKNVRNEIGAGNDIFDRAIIAGADLSTVLGGEITGSALQLGKALQEPIRGMSLLGRAGVQFTAEQKELVRSLVEEGDLLSAQKIILGEVEGQVGGAAEAAARASDRIAASIGNVAEEIGLGLLPAADELADRLPKIVEDLAPQAQQLGEAVGSVMGLLVDGFIAVSPLIGVTTELLLTFVPVLELAVDLLGAIPDPLLQAAAAFVLFNKAGGALGPTITNLRTIAQITSAVAASRGVSTLTVGLEGLRARAGEAAGGLRGLTTGLSGASIAAGLGLTAVTLYSNMLAEARAEGEAFGAALRESFDPSTASLRELTAASADLDTKIADLEGSVDDSFLGRNGVNKDFNEALRAGITEAEAFQAEIDAARIELLRLEAETVFRAVAHHDVGIADAVAAVRGESASAADAITEFRTGGDTSADSFLRLATVLGDAELSEEGMAEAARILGTDVESLTAFIENTNVALQAYIDTAVNGLPGVAEAFRDTNEDSKVSAREFITGLAEDTVKLEEFLGDIRTLIFAGFGDVAATLAEQGVDVAGTVAQQMADAAIAGNTRLLEETRFGLGARDAAIADSTDLFVNQLGPDYVTANGTVAAEATEAFGVNYNPAQQVEIAMALAGTELDTEGQRVAAIAATQGATAARKFGIGLNLDEVTINEAVAAGVAITHIDSTIWSEAGVALGLAFGDGVGAGLRFSFADIESEAARMANRAEAAARSASESESPSKVFMRVGRDWGLGAAVGLDQAGVEIVRAAEQIVADAARAVEVAQIVASPTVGIDVRELTGAAAPSAAGGRAAALQGALGGELAGAGGPSVVFDLRDWHVEGPDPLATADATVARLQAEVFLQRRS